MVATPIGNLGDMGQRAIDVLGAVALVAAEDTRRTQTLLNHFGIRARLLSLHEHNEADRVARVEGLLAAGSDVALVSDAGTPLISDPGYILVSALRESGYRISPIPGPCAITAALSAAGLPTDRFTFEGFLPAKPSARRTALADLKGERRTMVFYESPHRIEQALSDMAGCFGGDRQAVLAREITKLHESLRSGTLSALADLVGEGENEGRGELVVIVRGDDTPDDPDTAEAMSMLAVLAEELPARRAAELVARITGASKNRLYKRYLENKEGKE